MTSLRTDCWRKENISRADIPPFSGRGREEEGREEEGREEERKVRKGNRTDIDGTGKGIVIVSIRIA